MAVNTGSSSSPGLDATLNELKDVEKTTQDIANGIAKMAKEIKTIFAGVHNGARATQVALAAYETAVENVTGETRKYQQETLKATKATSGFQDATRNAQGATGSYQKFMLATTKAAIAFKVAIQPLSRVISTLSAEMDALGKTSRKLGITVENLQGLRHAADQTGVKLNTLEQALQRSTRRISEAARGYGEARGALAELGLSASKLNKLSPDKQLNEIADAMEDVTNQSDKVRLAMKLFDSEGVAMVNMLSGGSKALAGYSSDLQKLGVITTAQVNNVERMNDSLDKLSKAYGILGTTILADFAPVLQDISDFLTSISGSLKSAITRVVAFAGLATASFVAIGSAAKLAYAEMFGNPEEIAQAYYDLSKYLDVMQSLKDEMDTGARKPELPLMGDKGSISYSSLEKQLTMYEQLKRAAQEYYWVNTEEAGRATAAVAGMASAMSSAVNQGFRDMMNGAWEWGKAFENVIKDIVAQLINLYVTQQAVNAIIGGFGGISGGTMNGGTASVSGMAASGGVVRRGGSYLVGEKGPEIVSLPGNANVTPNGASMAPSVTVNNYGNDNVNVKQGPDGQIEIVIAQIVNDITRGGPVGDSMQKRYGLSKK